jgi:hypothetical protein
MDIATAYRLSPKASLVIAECRMDSLTECFQLRAHWLVVASDRVCLVRNKAENQAVQCGKTASKQTTSVYVDLAS